MSFDENRINERMESWLEKLGSQIILLENASFIGDYPSLVRGISVIETKILAIPEFKQEYDELVKPHRIWFKKIIELIKKPAHWNNTWYESQIVEPMNNAKIEYANRRLGVIHQTLDRSDAIIKRMKGDFTGI